MNSLNTVLLCLCISMYTNRFQNKGLAFTTSCSFVIISQLDVSFYLPQNFSTTRLEILSRPKAPGTQKEYFNFLMSYKQILIISNLSISQESPELVHELTHELAHELSIPKNQKDCKRLKKIQKIAKNPIDSKNI